MRQAIRYSRFPVPAPAVQGELRQVFDAFFQAGERDAARLAPRPWTPQVDVREEDDRFVILADLPGIDPQDVEVLMDKGVLSLRGERAAPSDTDGARLARVERRHGAFHRRFALPDSADADGVTAFGRNGVLEIRIPKRTESAPRRVQVERAAIEPAASEPVSGRA